jgi:hypothetical protein
MTGNPSKQRRAPRVPLDTRVRLCWTNENGDTCVTYGRSVDISEVGLCVRTEVAVPPRSYVSFRLETGNFEGSASVRHVRRAGLKHVIGLDFCGGLRWRNPAQGER